MTTRSYEAMFLLDNQAAQADWDTTSGVVDAILQKHGATLVQKEKWDERKLAYEIKGQRRATYYLVYFDAPPAAMARIDEDVRLSESVLRHMAFSLDEPIEEHVRKRTEERELLAEDSRRHAMSGWGGEGGRRRKGRGRGDDDDDRGGRGRGRDEEE
jgi:small subunit ribosomal protein S6